MARLDNIRIIDFSRLLPGPYCTMILADMGADVIKVESTVLGDPSRITPPLEDGESLNFATINRNKRSLAINHRQEAGKQVLAKLIATGDVLIETFKPGQAARMGLDYGSVQAVNERIVYCSLSGYGQQGHYADRSGHDLNFLALSGLLDLNRDREGRPVIPSLQLADVAGGSLVAVIAILAALLERAGSGRGQYLDVSIWEGTASLLPVQWAPILAGLSASSQRRTYLSGDLPGYNVYETADGQHMAVAALEPILWIEFCKAVSREDLIPHQFPEEEERGRVLAEMAAIFRTRTRSEWEAFFADKDLCTEPVLTLDEAAGRTLGRLGDNIVTIDRGARQPLRQIASPTALTAGAPPPRPAPALGQHTVEILSELGYSSAQIEELRTRKIVATPDDTTERRLRGLR